MTAPEQFAGFVGFGTGTTRVRLILDGSLAAVTVRARWMGGGNDHDIQLCCRHEALSASFGVLTLRAARSAEGEDIGLLPPPSDGPVRLEYVRLPAPQPVTHLGSDMMAHAAFNEAFSLVLWTHPDAAFDDGTQLEPEEYDTPTERFAPVARALEALARPWKLELVR